MNVDLFDCQVETGLALPGQRYIFDVDELTAEMSRVSIGRSLVRIGPEKLDQDFTYSNSRLFNMCSADESLVPCPVVVPNTVYDLPREEEQMDCAVENGAGAAFIRPEHDSWLLEEWVSDPLFKAMESRRLPLYTLERMVPVDSVAELAGRYPDLPIISAGGNYRSQRTYMPLLENFPNVSLSIGNNNDIWMGIEQIVERCGPERLLFGTNYPETEAMTAVTMLVYADISDEAKQMIGSTNMDNLMKGIVR